MENEGVWAIGYKLIYCTDKDKCGLDKRLHCNLPKREDTIKLKCTSEKGVAIMDVFEHIALM